MIKSNIDVWGKNVKKIMKLFRRIVLGGLILVLSGLLSLGMGMNANAEEEAPRYEIRVNRAANCVTIYEKDATGAYTVPVKSMATSCGIELDLTPLGTFSTSDYYKWCLMVDNTYGQYAVRVIRGIMFHSVTYETTSPNTLLANEYNKLGEPASHGCIRLTTGDAKWLYENCEKGTKVIIYDDAETPGPIGKPETMKLPENHPYKGWDPTDISREENPWKEELPQIYLTRDMGDGVIYVPVGSTQEDLKAALGLRNAQGLPYGGTDYQIQVRGIYDLNTFGAYKVWVTGIDAIGRMIEKEMMLAVVYM